MLLKIYNSLNKIASHSTNAQNTLLQSSTRNRAERTQLISRLRQINRGLGRRRGVEGLMRDILKQIPVIGSSVTTAPQVAEIDNVASLSNPEDQSYHVLNNILRVLDGLTLSLDAILSSNRDLRIYS